MRYYCTGGVDVSIDTYEQMLEVNETDTSITEAEHESAYLIDAREALLSLRRKHFG